MSQRTEIILGCDMPHPQEVHKDVETVDFGFGGTNYQAEMCKKGREVLRRIAEEYIPHARPVASNGAGKPGRRPGGNSSESKARRVVNSQMRAWARDQGIALSERGRIPAEVVAKYEAAQR